MERGQAPGVDRVHHPDRRAADLAVLDRVLALAAQVDGERDAFAAVRAVDRGSSDRAAAERADGCGFTRNELIRKSPSEVGELGIGCVVR